MNLLSAPVLGIAICIICLLAIAVFFILNKIASSNSQPEVSKKKETLEKLKLSVSDSFNNAGIAVSFKDLKSFSIVDEDIGIKVTFYMSGTDMHHYDCWINEKLIPFMEIAGGPSKGIISLMIGYGNYLDAYKIISNWLKANKGRYVQ